MPGYLEPAGPRVALRPLTRRDEAEFIALARASAGPHQPWLQLPGTPEEFGAFVSRFADPQVNVGLAACDRAGGGLVGGININDIVRGRFQNGFLGYWAFAPSAGRGYLSEALPLAIRYAFCGDGAWRGHQRRAITREMMSNGHT